MLEGEVEAQVIGSVLAQCGLWPGQVGVGVWARWNLATVPGGTHWGMQA